MVAQYNFVIFNEFDSCKRNVKHIQTSKLKVAQKMNRV